MRPLEIKILKVLGCAFLLFVVASIFFPLFAAGYINSKRTLCLWNLKRQAIGLTMYAGNHDERLPFRDAWMDRIASNFEG